jgi:V8-like Glu-specific endopeptidase
MKLSLDQQQLIREAAARLKKEHPDLLAKVRTNAGYRINRISELADDTGFNWGAARVPIDRTEQVTLVEEIILLTEGRPGILIANNKFDLQQHPNLPDAIASALTKNRALLASRLPAIGRIEVMNHPRYSWLGTGFLIAEDVLATNRHVAIEIAYRDKDGKFRFIEGVERPKSVSARIDYLEEHLSDKEANYEILDVLYIEDIPGPDLAFLKVRPRGAEVQPIQLQLEAPQTKVVAAVGYPTKDTRGNTLAEVLTFLGDIFNKKRLSPGLFQGADGGEFTHDCSTLGGNSGSPVLDVETGYAIGVHAGGLYPKINTGVSAPFVLDALEKTLGRGRVQPVRPDAIAPARPRPETPNRPERPEAPVDQDKLSDGQRTATIGRDDGEVTWEVPLIVKVSMGQHRLLVDRIERSQLAQEDPLAEAQRRYGNLAGVVRIRKGFLIQRGYSTDAPALIVAVSSSFPDSQRALISTHVQGLPIAIRPASPDDLLVAANLDSLLERVPRINYEKPANLSLDAVEDVTYAVFHVSPDSGWPQLRDFLRRTRNRLTIGLYNFSTEHVEKALLESLGRNGDLKLVLCTSSIDSETIKEYEEGLIQRLSDALPGRFDYKLAEAPGHRLFAGHYHIKVAVRDREAFWISSGNWDHSNQPETEQIDLNERSWDPLKESNREWHAVVVNARLAETFEDYLNYDFESYSQIPESPISQNEEPLFLVPSQILRAFEERPRGNPKYFPPKIVDNRRIRIQPVLSPDNYVEHVLEVIQAARDTIDIQNQSFKWKDDADERFAELGEAILERQRRGATVRIIIRGEYGGQEQKDLLKQKGFRDRQIRILDKVHTKGVIVDSRVVVLGSHNWTDHGVLANRDASLIVYDRDVAEYFQDIFNFDWERASEFVPEIPPGITFYRRGDPIPEGYQILPWSDVV